MEIIKTLAVIDWEAVAITLAAIAHGISKLFWIFKNGKSSNKLSGND